MVIHIATKTNIRIIQRGQLVSRYTCVRRRRDLGAVRRADARAGWTIPVVAAERAEAGLVGVACVGAGDAD